MSTPGASIFEIAEHCNREQFDELIGDYAGIVVSDRWPGYQHLDPNRRQVCWSHLQRDFRCHSEGLAEQKTFGEQGLKLTGRVFLEHGAPTSTSTKAATGWRPRSSRPRPNCKRSSNAPAARANGHGFIACSRTTS